MSIGLKDASPCAPQALADPLQNGGIRDKLPNGRLNAIDELVGLAFREHALPAHRHIGEQFQIRPSLANGGQGSAEIVGSFSLSQENERASLQIVDLLEEAGRFSLLLDGRGLDEPKRQVVIAMAAQGVLRYAAIAAYRGEWLFRG